MGQLQMVYNHKPSQYFHKYAFEKISPLYPFGYGLSYTTFEIGKPLASEKNWDGSGKLLINVEVENAGNRKGTEVVQLYIRDNFSSVTRPVLELKGYQRVTLEPSGKKTLIFELDNKAFAFYDKEMKYVSEEGDFTILIGNSSNKKHLKETNVRLTQHIYHDEY